MTNTISKAAAALGRKGGRRNSEAQIAARRTGGRGKGIITQRLAEHGAVWAVRADKFIDPSDGWDAQATYHVHPERSNPRQDQIMRFASLKAISAWLDAVDHAATLPEDQRIDYMQSNGW